MVGHDLRGELSAVHWLEQDADDHHIRPIQAARSQGLCPAVGGLRVVAAFDENDGERLRHRWYCVYYEDSKAADSGVDGMHSFGGPRGELLAAI